MSKTRLVQYEQAVKRGYDYRRAMEEAARCLLCYDAPCSQACPASTDPAKFIRSLRFKNIYGGAETIRRNNPFGGTCAEICPRENLCEEACSRSGIDKPINIGKLQKFLMEQEKVNNMEFTLPVTMQDKSVACIGAGPASLSCARELAQRGYGVTVFEAQERPGGMLSYGIPPFRLPQAVVDADIKAIEKAGVKIICNRTISTEELTGLQENYDAVFLGVGLNKAKILDIPGHNLEGVMSALDFLRRAKTGTLPFLDKSKVIVIGGGDVAMDCAATAKAVGAKSTIVYRRTREEAPATGEEMDLVMQMGVAIITEFVPVKFLGDNGRVTGLKAQGRDGSSQLTLQADYIIVAIGQEVAAEFNSLKNKPGIYMGGDMTADSGHTVVDAVAAGKRVAEEIVKFLEGGSK